MDDERVDQNHAAVMRYKAHLQTVFHLTGAARWLLYSDTILRWSRLSRDDMDDGAWDHLVVSRAGDHVVRNTILPTKSSFELIQSALASAQGVRRWPVPYASVEALNLLCAALRSERTSTGHPQILRLAVEIAWTVPAGERRAARNWMDDRIEEASRDGSETPFRDALSQIRHALS